MGTLFLQGLQTVLGPQFILWQVIGTVVGIIFGAIPGLTAVMAIALFLPMTYGMSMELGISVLIALYIGAISGGLISAILLKIPGTPSSVASCWDGHPLAEKGQAVKALGVGIVFSFMGTIVSLIALVFIAPTLAKVALKFGPHEYFAIAVFSLTLIATLSTGSIVKGIFSGLIGWLFATVGIAPVDANVRFTFGRFELNNGFDTLTVLIGLFAITEIIKVAESVKHEAEGSVCQVSMYKKLGLSVPETWDQFIANLQAMKKAGIQPLANGGKDGWTLEVMMGSICPNWYGANDFYQAVVAGKTTFQDPRFVNAIAKLKELTPYMPGSDVTSIPYRWIPEKPLWSNYYRALKGSDGSWIYLRNILNSFIVATTVACSSVLLASSVGYGLAKFKFKGRNIVFMRGKGATCSTCEGTFGISGWSTRPSHCSSEKK